MGRSVFLQGWGTEAAASVGSPSQRLHPPGLGTPPALLAALSAWEGGPRSGALGPLSAFPARPRPLQPPLPHGTTTYSVGEGKYWKSGDLQFLQKRNSLARCSGALR